MTNIDSTPIAANLIDAAAIWLDRIGAAADCIVVCTIAPTPAVGLWAPGLEHVRLGGMDDPGTEVLEAVGPFAERVLADLALVEREQVFGAVLAGGRLQALVAPADCGAVLRLTQGGRAVTIGTVVVERVVH